MTVMDTTAHQAFLPHDDQPGRVVPAADSGLAVRLHITAYAGSI
jgi:hypothetical protein